MKISKMLLLIVALCLMPITNSYGMIRVNESNYKQWNLSYTEVHKKLSWLRHSDIIQKKLEEVFQKFNPVAALSFEEFKQQRKLALAFFVGELTSLEQSKKYQDFGTWNWSFLIDSCQNFLNSEDYLEMRIKLPYEDEITECVAQLRKLDEKYNVKSGIAAYLYDEYNGKREPLWRKLIDLQNRWEYQKDCIFSDQMVSLSQLEQSSSPATTPTPPSSLISQKLTSLKKHFVNNLGYILAAAAITSYGLVIFKLFKEGQFVRDEENWSAHEDYMPAETFFMRPMQETTDELLRAIMLRYKPSGNNMGLAVEQFMADTKAEMKRLKNFLAWHEWLDYLMLDAIFPDQPEMVHLAKVKLLKLEYMQHVLQGQRVPQPT